MMGTLPPLEGRSLTRKTDCWSTRYSCFRCGVPRYFDGIGVEQGLFGVGLGKGGGMPGLQGQGVGAAMSRCEIGWCSWPTHQDVCVGGESHAQARAMVGEEPWSGGAGAWCVGKQGSVSGAS